MPNWFNEVIKSGNQGNKAGFSKEEFVAFYDGTEGMTSKSYYHVTSPENAKQIVEHQMIPAGNFGGTGWELPWIKEQFDIGKLDPGIDLVMFFQNKEEAKDYLHSQTVGSQSYPIESYADKGALVWCVFTPEQFNELKKWPNDIAIHTPTPSMPETPRTTPTPRSRPHKGHDRATFNTQLLTTAYYLPSDEDIPGKFEVVT